MATDTSAMSPPLSIGCMATKSLAPCSQLRTRVFTSAASVLAASHTTEREISMNRHSIASAFVAAATFAFASTAVVAAEPAPKPPSAMSGKDDMSKHHGKDGMKDGMGGMGGGDMQGMMGMMNSCQSMMAKAKDSGNTAMPQLPPGNEKLEFQMHAEMMQKMGEIAARYAERIKESK
ncbi:MAG: hypothetical protein ABIQ06_12370 [Caldimonas sp.]